MQSAKKVSMYRFSHRNGNKMHGCAVKEDIGGSAGKGVETMESKYIMHNN